MKKYIIPENKFRIYRCTMVFTGIDYHSKEGTGTFLFNAASLDQWFDLEKDPEYPARIVLLLSRRPFEESLKLTPTDERLLWNAALLSGEDELVAIYERTTRRLLKLSQTVVHIGVEIPDRQ